jgi:5'-3' exonuclease
MRTLLIDGDGVAWRAAFGGEHVEAKAINMIRKYKRELMADRPIVAFSDPTRRYFRHDIWPTYKSNPSKQIEGLDVAKRAISEEFITRVIDGLEADDVLGILATTDTLQGERIIVASDKDLLQIPGEHYDPVKDKKVHQDLIQADYFFLFQTLTGDSGEFPGCPKVGPVGAQSILDFQEEHDWNTEAWDRVVEAFKKRKLTEEDALIQARVARICRASDFDLGSKKVIPWEPTRSRKAA